MDIATKELNQSAAGRSRNEGERPIPRDGGVMRKPKVWNCDVYDVEFRFCIGWKASDYCKYVLKTFGDDHDYSNYQGMFSQYGLSDGKNIGVIWTDKKDIGTIVHECLHATLRCLEHREVKLDYDNQEPIAYLHECIVKQALKDQK